MSAQLCLRVSRNSHFDCNIHLCDNNFRDYLFHVSSGKYDYPNILQNTFIIFICIDIRTYLFH